MPKDIKINDLVFSTSRIEANTSDGNTASFVEVNDANNATDSNGKKIKINDIMLTTDKITANTADITAAISELPQHSATLLPYIEMKFNEVEELSDTTRGDGGFGSTGEK